MTDELLPCPFCGGSDLHVETENGIKVVCVECDGTTIAYIAHDLAIKAWNRRSETYELGRAIERARSELKWTQLGPTDGPIAFNNSVFFEYTPQEMHAAIDAVEAE